MTETRRKPPTTVEELGPAPPPGTAIPEPEEAAPPAPAATGPADGTPEAAEARMAEVAPNYNPENTPMPAIPEAHDTNARIQPQYNFAPIPLGGGAGPGGASTQGRSWEDRRSAFMAAAARASGSMADFVSAREMWAGMEQKKMLGHMQAALMLSQQGNQQAAARELQAAGTYMFPDTVGQVAPNPDGTFNVTNIDAITGEVQSQYPLAPENIMETMMMMSDPEAYMEFAFNREVSNEEMQLKWETQNMAIREHMMAGDLNAAQTTRARLDALTSAYEAEVARTTMDDAIVKAEADARAAVSDADYKKYQAANEALDFDYDLLTFDARVAAQEAAAGKALTEEEQAFLNAENDYQSSALELIQERHGPVMPTESEMGEVTNQPKDADGNPIDPHSLSPLYKQDERSGQWVPNATLESAILAFTNVLHAADPELTPLAAADAISALLFQEDVSFKFLGDGENEPFRVRINTQYYDLPQDPAVVQTIKELAISNRIAGAVNSGLSQEEAAKLVTEDGNGFDNLARRDVIEQGFLTNKPPTRPTNPWEVTQGAREAMGPPPVPPSPITQTMAPQPWSYEGGTVVPAGGMPNGGIGIPVPEEEQ